MQDLVASFAIALGDDALVLGHRLSEWSSNAPSLEEDIALSNLGLDLIGQARLFYQLGARLEGRGRDEDKLAYFRDTTEFRNLLLMELPRGDFAFTMARQLAVSLFLQHFYECLARSTESALAEIAAKSVKEMAYHVRHSAEWVIRLGDGTDESHRRMQAGLLAIWPYTGEMFEVCEEEQRLLPLGIAPDRAALKDGWVTMMGQVLDKAGLDWPKVDAHHIGGRSGRHTPHLLGMLAEMQSLARAYPGAVW